MRFVGDKTLREPDVAPLVTVCVGGGSYLAGMVVDWDVALGTVTRRKAVSEKFGGNPQAGILHSPKSLNVCLFSDPKVGAQHGYNFDGWAEDGAFYYTGAGQEGPQTEDNQGNRAVLNHVADGRTLRVFKVVKSPPGKKGGKPHRYIGSFRLDPDAPWRPEEAPDREGVTRTVMVFRLLPIDAESPVVTVDLPATAPAQELLPPESIATELAPEKNVAREFKVAARAAAVARRREAELMADLEDTLRSRGRKVRRLGLAVPGSSVPLKTDTFDATSNVLYEVKASNTRQMVRVALGQLMDYRRFVDDLAHCTVVLPERPTADLIELVHAVGFDLVVREGKSFVRITPDGIADLR